MTILKMKIVLNDENLKILIIIGLICHSFSVSLFDSDLYKTYREQLP